MSATGKTLGGLAVIVLGLAIYALVFVGAGPLKISFFNLALYVAEVLCAAVLLLIIGFTTYGGEKA